MFDAASPIGRKSNAIDGLSPFMSDAVCDWNDDVDQINTIFYLLQEDLVLVKSCTEALC